VGGDTGPLPLSLGGDLGSLALEIDATPEGIGEGHPLAFDHAEQPASEKEKCKRLLFLFPIEPDRRRPTNSQMSQSLYGCTYAPYQDQKR